METCIGLDQHNGPIAAAAEVYGVMGLIVDGKRNDVYPLRHDDIIELGMNEVAGPG